MTVGNVLPDTQALRLVRPTAVYDNLDGYHAAQLSHGAAGERGFTRDVGLPLPFSECAVPAENVHKQAGKIKGAKVLFKEGKVEFGHKS